ncbi:MAG: hypothetical protein GY747_02145 [Planctomycetes bacterium]|nr:hypothetical protein [Planctomycetota bacterium]MCP4770030.1 hypothetical protein [Planctomycetota bacterium]MCP4859870.1 hypothetical protein [Planctomycetota bacterium]
MPTPRSLPPSCLGLALKLAALLVLLLSWSCSEQRGTLVNFDDALPAEAVSPEQPELKKTRVFVLGMLHDGHHTSETWGLEQVRETIRRINPDVIGLELSDDNLAAVLETWTADQTVEDERALRFPEYVQVVLPLMDEMGFDVASIAMWHEMLDGMRRGKIAEFNTKPEFEQQRADYADAKAWTKEWLAAREFTADDPYYIHSWDADIYARGKSGAYDYYLNEVIGRPSGWTYVHDEHYEKIINVLRDYPGQTVLLTFGTNHIYWFHELLRWHPDVELVDVRPYLPGGDDWQLTAAERAIEEFHAGVDCLRIVWSHFRGDTLYAWQRIDAMVEIADADWHPLRTALKAGQGLQLSEFKDGPWLGKPEILEQGEDWWQLQVPVRRYGDKAEDAEWLRARLQIDAERPGGFVWTSLEVPGWLVN